MSDMAPDYPPLLTDKSWQKKKGVVSKITGKTGIGKALDACKAAYDKVDWAEFDVKQKAETSVTLNDLVEIQRTASRYYETSIRKHLLPALAAAGKKADEAKKVWAKNKAIPKGSLQHLDAVIREITEFTDTVGPRSFDNRVQGECRILRDDKKREIAAASAQIKKRIAGVLHGIGTIKTVNDYTGPFLTTRVHGLWGAVQSDAKMLGLASEERSLKALLVDSGIPGTDEEVPGKINEIVRTMKAVLAAV
ncbi:MAG: hypothetical protein AAFR79_17185 [Pseudomonadota bacterium]